MLDAKNENMKCYSKYQVATWGQLFNDKPELSGLEA